MGEEIELIESKIQYAIVEDASEMGRENQMEVEKC